MPEKIAGILGSDKLLFHIHHKDHEIKDHELKGIFKLYYIERMKILRIRSWYSTNF